MGTGKEEGALLTDLKFD